MNDETVRATIIAFVTAIVMGAIFLVFAPKGSTIVTAGSSPQGTTVNSAKFAGASGVALATPGANATSTSILNTDANDRLITGIRMSCEKVGTSQTAYTGAGLATWQITVGTTSTAAPAATPVGFNEVGGVSYVISTSTPNFALATTTPQVGGLSSTTVVWAAGSNLTFFSNATNTAICTLGADYVQS